MVYFSAFYGHTAMLLYLVSLFEKSEKSNVKNLLDHNRTALMYAIDQGHFKTAEAFIRNYPKSFFKSEYEFLLAKNQFKLAELMVSLNKVKGDKETHLMEIQQAREKFIRQQLKISQQKLATAISTQDAKAAEVATQRILKYTQYASAKTHQTVGASAAATRGYGAMYTLPRKTVKVDDTKTQTAIATLNKNGK